MKAGVVAATIAQTDAIRNQGGSINLQRFEARDPPALKGGGELMMAGHCFQLVGKDTDAAVAIIAQVSAVAATIARTSATVGQGGTSNLHGFQAHHSLTYMRGRDSMVRTSLAIEREVEDIQSICDMGASAKRKENQSSSSSKKKQKTSTSYGFQGRGRGYQSQGQVGASSQTGI